jgi:hypothetical protein
VKKFVGDIFEKIGWSLDFFGEDMFNDMFEQMD